MSGDSSKDPVANSAPPARVPWQPWRAVVIVVGSFLLSQSLASLLISGIAWVYGTFHNWNSAAMQAWVTHSTVAQFLFTFLAYALLLAFVFPLVHRHKVPLAVFGFKRPKLRDPLYALLALPVYYVLYIVAMLIAVALFPSINLQQSQQLGFSGIHDSAGLLLAFISLAVIPPFAEEAVMRGFLYTSLRKRYAVPAATVITSLLFAFGHLQFGSGTPLLWTAAIFTFVLSLVLVFLRQATGRIWAPMLLHAMVNSISFYQLFIK